MSRRILSIVQLQLHLLVDQQTQTTTPEKKGSTTSKTLSMRLLDLLRKIIIYNPVIIPCALCVVCYICFNRENPHIANSIYRFKTTRASKYYTKQGRAEPIPVISKLAPFFQFLLPNS